MAYSAYKDLARRITSDEVLGDKTFQFASNPQCYGYQREFKSNLLKVKKIQQINN